MNAERLLEHFDRISDAADAVPRLRRFVLDLAVQGRLVRQQDSATTHRLAAKPCAFSNADVWELPTNWAFVELQQLAGSKGLFIDGDWVESKDQDPNGSIRLTQLADVGVGTFRDRSARFMNEETAARLGCTFLATGDVLIARMPDPLGRACIFPGDKRKCVTVVDVAIMRPGHDDIDPTFIVHAINSPLFAQNVTAKAAGTTRSRISRGNLAKLPFPLPPLAEQHRIVAKVDELMALCDRLEAAQTKRQARRDRLVSASLARVTNPDSDDANSATTSARFYLDHFARLTTRPEHVKQLRQTILNLAVRGRLVPQDPTDGPAAIPIPIESNAARKRPRRKQPHVDHTVVPADCPRSWICEPLGELVESERSISYGVLVPGPDAVNGIPFVRAQDLSLALDPERPTRTISPEVERPYARTRLHGDEILLCVVGSIGKLGLAPPSWAGANIARAVARIAPRPEVLREFLLIVLRSSPVQTYFQDATRTLAQPTLNVGLIEQTPIPLPPLAEQRRIVARVDELMALCDQLEASLASAATDRARLLEALLHEALAPAA
jgi:type I restriction enzyme S subunit